MSKPTVLFVHGSWHTPTHFGPVVEVFEKAGYPASCPRQPSAGALPPISLKDDAQCITNELEKLVELEGKDVFVVGHSYGGVVTTQAVHQRFAKKEREGEGKKGGVIRLVYLCAFLLPVGVGLAGAMGGELPPFITVDDQDLLTMHDPGLRFYNDLDDASQQKWIKELVLVPRATNYDPISYAAYLYHPVTYLFCEIDEALPVSVQKMMVEKLREHGVTIDEDTCTSGHSPFLSKPEKVLEIVNKVVA